MKRPITTERIRSATALSITLQIRSNSFRGNVHFHPMMKQLGVSLPGAFLKTNPRYHVSRGYHTDARYRQNRAASVRRTPPSILAALSSSVARSSVQENLVLWRNFGISMPSNKLECELSFSLSCSYQHAVSAGSYPHRAA